MNSAPIAKRQTVLARTCSRHSNTHDGSIVEYAKLHDLKTKDIYQWKTSLIKKGFLPVADNPPSADFITIHPADAAAVHPEETRSVSCRIVLACGAVLELFTPHRTQ